MNVTIKREAVISYCYKAQKVELPGPGWSLDTEPQITPSVLCVSVSVLP